MVVCLGATAASDSAGQGFRVTERDGQLMTDPSRRLFLRPCPSPFGHPRPRRKNRGDELRQFISDLRKLRGLYNLELSRTVNSTGTQLGSYK